MVVQCAKKEKNYKPLPHIVSSMFSANINQSASMNIFVLDYWYSMLAACACHQTFPGYISNEVQLGHPFA